MLYLLFIGIVVALLLGTGVFFTLKFGFFQIKGIGFVLKNTICTLFKKDEEKKKGAGVSPFQAMATALAGSMGVGNIAGVATALVAGGAGAIFWMWVGAFFGMMTKYAEIYLAVLYRKRDKKGQYYGGPMYYMRDGMKKNGLAGLFALLCALTSLGIGNLTQSNAVSTAMQSAFSIPLYWSGIIVAVIVAMVVFGGVTRIIRVNEFIIPFISILYICFAGAFLYIHRGMIGGAFQLIVRQAFGLRSVAAGAAGYGVSAAIRLGLSRGVFTHEAGMGSAPIAHAAADCKSPAHQAAWGIFEVFLDTIVVCTITALVLLCADGGTLWYSGSDGAALTTLAFESAFSGFGSKFIAISILIFAVSAMLGWCYYGEASLRFLLGDNKKAIDAYRIIFLGCILMGSMGEIKVIWTVSDILNILMALPNLVALFALRNQIEIPSSKNKKGLHNEFAARRSCAKAG